MSQTIENRGMVYDKSLNELYAWIDLVPLSREKKNISRDFSDAVLLAEIIAHFAPRIIELHNYPPAGSIMQKKVNWITLNRKVFPKLGFKLSEAIIRELSESKPGAVEKVLMDVRKKLDEFNSAPVRRVGTAPGRNSPSTNVRRSVYVPPKTAPAPVYNVESVFARPAETNYTPPGTLEYIRNFSSPGYEAQSDKVSKALADGPVSDANDNDPTMTSASQPQATLEEKEREIKDLQVQLQIVENKVLRMETLVNVKDQRIAELTLELHEVRAKSTCQRSPRQSWIGMEP